MPLQYCRQWPILLSRPGIKGNRRTIWYAHSPQRSTAKAMCQPSVHLHLYDLTDLPNELNARQLGKLGQRGCERHFRAAMHAHWYARRFSVRFIRSPCGEIGNGVCWPEKRRGARAKESCCYLSTCLLPYRARLD